MVVVVVVVVAMVPAQRCKSSQSMDPPHSRFQHLPLQPLKCHRQLRCRDL